MLSHDCRIDSIRLMLKTAGQKCGDCSRVVFTVSAMGKPVRADATELRYKYHGDLSTGPRMPEGKARGLVNHKPY